MEKTKDQSGSIKIQKIEFSLINLLTSFRNITYDRSDIKIPIKILDRVIKICSLPPRINGVLSSQFVIEIAVALDSCDKSNPHTKIFFFEYSPYSLHSINQKCTLMEGFKKRTKK